MGCILPVFVRPAIGQMRIFIYPSPDGLELCFGKLFFQPGKQFAFFEADMVVECIGQFRKELKGPGVGAGYYGVDQYGYPVVLFFCAGDAWITRQYKEK